MTEDPRGTPDRDDTDAEEPPGTGEVPDSLDVQPEDPDYPGRDSPDPID